MCVHVVDLEVNEMLIDHLLNAAVYFIACLILLLIGIFSFRLFNPTYKVKDELVEKDNFSFAIV